MTDEPIVDAPVIPASPEPGVGRRIAIGAAYMVAARFALRSIGLISTLILVRLLAPSDFGLVGMASAVNATLDLLTATGFNLAIVRMSTPDKAHYDTAWTLGLGRGLFIAIGLVLTAHLQADLVHDPRVAGVMRVMALSVLLQALENPTLIAFEQEMRFDRLMRYQVAGKLVAFVLTLTLAFTLHSYWALVLGLAGAKLFTVPYSYVLRPHRPRFTLACWRDLFHFSKYMAVTNVLGSLERHSLNYVIGYFRGTAAVGVYQVTNQVAALPISEIAAPMRDPFYAGFARIREQRDLLARHFIDGFAITWMILLPLSAGVAVTAWPVVAVFMGLERWAAAVTLLPLLAAYALVDSIGHYTHAVFMVLDRQALFLKTFLPLVLLRVPLMVAGAAWGGMEGAVWAMLLTAALNAVIWMVQVQRLLGFSTIALLAGAWRTTVAAVCMVAGVLGLAQALPIDFPPVLRLLAEVAAGGWVHVGVQLALWQLAGRPANAPESRVTGYALAALGRIGRLLGRAAAPAG